jgi:regulator of sigma E protease
MNILIALLLVFAVMKVGLKQPTNVVAQVVPKSPAAQVGIKANDRVVSIAGKKTSSWSQVMKTIQAHAGQKVTVKVRRDGKTLTFQVKLRQKPNKKGLLGIVTKLKRQSLSTVAALKEALNFMATATVLIFQFLGKLVSVPSQVAGQLRSPIGVVQETAPIAQRDLLEYLITLAGISLAVGIFNVLPLPPLDGGRLALAAIEAVRRRPFTKETAIAINVIGLAILLTLMTYVIVADISRIAVNSG